MARKPISDTVKKELYANSNNQCAFPGCEEKLFENGSHIGKMAHIEGYSKNGPRYNPNLGDKVNDYDNLILLCGNCHDKIDQNPNSYPVAMLQKMKTEHISRMQSLLKQQAKHRWLSSKVLYDAQTLIGRNKQLKELADRLEENPQQAIISLNGLGGIGKTTLAKAFVQQHEKEYQHLIWISKKSSHILDDLARDEVLLEKLGLTEDFKNPKISRPQRLAIIKARLESKSGIKKLLVLDNVETELDNEEALKLLPQSKGWQLLVTSRRQNDLLPHIDLEVLPLKAAAQLFCRHYPKAATDAHLNDLLEHIGRHTFTIELLAKLMAKSARTKAINCQQLLKQLKAHKLADAALQKMLKAKSYTPKELSLLGHLSSAFKLDKLSELEIWWLRHFAVLPAQAYPYMALNDLLGIHTAADSTPYEESLNSLVQKGWIKGYETEAGYVFECHRLLQEILLYQKQTALGDGSHIENYILNIRNLIAVDATKEHWIDKKQWLPFSDRLYDLLKASCKSKAFARFLNEYAMLLKEAFANYEKAVEAYKKSLQIDLELEGEMGENVATCQSNLAAVYRNLGRYGEAAELLEKALASDIKNFGEQHPNVATRQSNLANVYKDLGRYEEAAQLLEKALASDISNFGQEHPKVAIRQSNLAAVYGDLGRYEEAAQLLEKALANGINNLGEHHPSVAAYQSNLAAVYRDLGRYEEAAQLLEKALANGINNLGEEHPNVAIRQSNLATVYYELGRYEEAAQLLENALASGIKIFGEEHPNVAISQSNLATVYGDLGMHEEAAQLLEMALVIDLKAFGLIHPNIATRLYNLFFPLMDTYQNEKAAACIWGALAIAFKTWGAAHPNTQTFINTLGWFIDKHPTIKPDMNWLAQLLNVQAQTVADLIAFAAEELQKMYGAE